MKNNILTTVFSIIVVAVILAVSVIDVMSVVNNFSIIKVMLISKAEGIFLAALGFAVIYFGKSKHNNP